MRRAALATLLLGLALVAAVLVVPYLAQERRVPASIPQPPPLFGAELVEVQPGASACLKGVTLGERAGVAELKVATFGRTAVPFTLTLSAPGYEAVARQPPTYADNAAVALRVAAPPRTLRGAACVRNQGTRRMALYASGDRTRRAAVATVDGRRERFAFQLALYERGGATLAARAPQIAERMATFRPVPPWVAGLLAVLVLAGVPVALVLAVGGAARDDEPRA